jgi:hypothetical protein
MTTPDGARRSRATARPQDREAIAVELRMRSHFREDGRMFAGVFPNGRNINALGMDTA